MLLCTYGMEPCICGRDACSQTYTHFIKLWQCDGWKFCCEVTAQSTVLDSDKKCFFSLCSVPRISTIFRFFLHKRFRCDISAILFILLLLFHFILSQLCIQSVELVYAISKCVSHSRMDLDIELKQMETIISIFKLRGVDKSISRFKWILQKP